MNGHREAQRPSPFGANNGPHELQQIASLFDHLVGAGEQRRRHSEAERLHGFGVDHQLVYADC
jgi:hypothetical protein